MKIKLFFTSRLANVVKFLALTSVILAGLSACSSTSTVSLNQVGNGIGGTDLINFPTSKDFYSVPTDIQSDPLGYVLRLQLVSKTSSSTSLKIMYVSKNTFGKKAAVTGLITYPNSAPPASGWPVISWDHGTSGISQSCAPSRAPYSLPTFGVTGVIVATDYLGLGPDGEIHPYLNRATEAEATIDIVRAALQIPDAHAGHTWLVVGDSQGGHAALATSQIAPSYAPNLNLIGSVAIGPGAELGNTYPGDNPFIYDIVATLAIFGAHVSDPSFNPNTYLVKAAQGVSKVVKDSCVNQITDYLLKVYLSDGKKILKVLPSQTPQGRAWLAQNDVIFQSSKNPILVLGGGQDIVAVPARVTATVKQLCKLKDTLYYDYLPTANHNTEMTQGYSLISSWIKDRLENKPAPDNCSSYG